MHLVQHLVQPSLAAVFTGDTEAVVRLLHVQVHAKGKLEANLVFLTRQSWHRNKSV